MKNQTEKLAKACQDTFKAHQVAVGKYYTLLMSGKESWQEGLTLWGQVQLTQKKMEFARIDYFEVVK